MTFHGFCPQCGTEIPRDRFVTGFAVCKCGWCDTTPVARAQKSSDKTVIASMFGAALVLIVMYAHLVSWGSYSTSIPFLKLGQITGTLGKSGYTEIADACTNLGKFDCARDAWMGLYRSKNDVDGLAQLGRLNVRLNDTQGALQAYGLYFRAGGNQMESALNYARVLEQTGKEEDALKYYEAAVKGSGEVLPIIATTGIVRILMKRGQYEQAFEKIQAFHESAGNAKGYLNTELLQLETYLNKQAKGSASSGKKKKA